MIAFADAVDEFMDACKADGLRQPTLDYYEYVLRPVVSLFGAAEVSEIKVADIRRYLGALRDKDTRYENAEFRRETKGGLSIETIRSRIRGLKRFFRWAWEEYNLAAPNPMDRIRMPPPPRHDPKAVEVEDLRKLLDVCGDDVAGSRDRAIILFLADTGCRAGGLISLKVSDCYLEEGYAIVHEKNDRRRMVLFSNITAEALRRWLTVRPADRPTVVYGLRRRDLGNPLTPAGLHRLLSRRGKQAGVKGRVNPHSLRHGFAREWMKRGGNLGDLSRVMGHSSIHVTAMFYAVFSGQEIADRHRQFSQIRSLGLEEDTK